MEKPDLPIPEELSSFVFVGIEKVGNRVIHRCDGDPIVALGLIELARHVILGEIKPELEPMVADKNCQ